MEKNNDSLSFIEKKYYLCCNLYFVIRNFRQDTREAVRAGNVCEKDADLKLMSDMEKNYAMLENSSRLRKGLLFIFLISTPLLFFFGLRLINFVIGSENTESIKSEVITAVFCGYAVSLGFWFNFLRKSKKKKQG